MSLCYDVDMIQLIALDLDDTLLTSHLEISPRNQQAIAEARRRGIPVVLASGRTPQAMARFAQWLNLFDRPGHLISDNGSTITTTQPQQTLVSHRLNRKLFHELLAFFREADLPVQVYTETHILVTKENPVTEIDVGLGGFTGWTLVTDMETSFDFLPSKLVVPGDSARLPVVLAQVRTRFAGRVNAFISKPIFLEILPPQADKGEALKWVATSLGIPAADILAIGDAANDLGMLRYAGHSVAMANAIAEVKAVAKSVTVADHDHDGVAEVIESVLKGL